MYSEQRRAEIVKIIEKNGSIDVNSLSDSFGISRETIRRDLSDLERQGVLKRTHGGAVLNTSVREYPVVVRGIQQVKEKKLVCRKAASYVKQGDTLFVDNSSTLLHLPQYLPTQLNITILTNSINFLLEAAKVSGQNWLMICLGGILNPSNLSVHGADTMRIAEEYYPSKAFFSCAGISPNNKVADSSLHEVQAKRMMISRAQETFLLADHTKMTKTGQIFLCDFEDIDYLVTTTDMEQESRAFLKQTGLNVVWADKD